MADAIPAILMPGIRKTSTIKRSSPAKMSDTIINTSINIFVLVFQLLYFFVADTDIQLGHFFQKLFSTFSNSKWRVSDSSFVHCSLGHIVRACHPDFLQVVIILLLCILCW